MAGLASRGTNFCAPAHHLVKTLSLILRGFLSHLNELLKNVRRRNGQLRDHFAINADLGLLDALHKAAIRDARFPTSGIDTGDPELSELTFFDLAVPKGIRQPLDQRPFGLTVTRAFLRELTFGLL